MTLSLFSIMRTKLSSILFSTEISKLTRFDLTSAKRILIKHRMTSCTDLGHLIAPCRRNSSVEITSVKFPSCLSASVQAQSRPSCMPRWAALTTPIWLRCLETSQTSGTTSKEILSIFMTMTWSSSWQQHFAELTTSPMSLKKSWCNLHMFATLRSKKRAAYCTTWRTILILKSQMR